MSRLDFWLFYRLLIYSTGVFRILHFPAGAKVIIKPYLLREGLGNALDLTNGGPQPGTSIVTRPLTRNLNQQVKIFPSVHYCSF